MLPLLESRSCTNIAAPTVLSYTTASISLLLSLVTIPGNFLVCLAVYINPYKNLRTPFNCVVVNLAIADLIVGCVTEPISTYVHVKEASGIPLFKLDVKSIHLSYFISCMASVLSISLLALERFLAISFSFRYRLYFKVRRFVAVSVVVWLVAIGLSSVYLFTNYLFYTFVFINIAVVWTLGVGTFCYAKILGTLRNRIIANRTRSISTLNTEPVTVRGIDFAASNMQNVLVTKTYMIILSMFLACYVPALSIIYTMNWCHSCSCISIHYMRDLQFLIVIFNSAVNPFVYAWRFVSFRRSILKILQFRKFRRI